MINKISGDDLTLLQQIQAANQNSIEISPYKLLKQLSNDFSTIDTNGDNKIDKKELKTYLTQLFQKQSQSGHVLNVDDIVNVLFSKLDPSQTGSIDKDALTNVLQKMSSMPAASRGDRPPRGGGKPSESSSTSQSSKYYDPRDTNKDGVVEESEQIAWDLKNGLTSQYSSKNSNNSTKSTDRSI